MQIFWKNQVKKTNLHACAKNENKIDEIMYKGIRSLITRMIGKTRVYLNQ